MLVYLYSKPIMMTKKEFRSSVSTRVRSIFKKTGLHYGLIDINDSLQTVSINGFFDQGESAQELIDDAESMANKTGLNIKTCMVFLLDSAGCTF